MPDYTSSPHDVAAARLNRLRALESYGVLDTAPEAALDSLVRLAAQLCDAPIGLDHPGGRRAPGLHGPGRVRWARHRSPGRRVLPHRGRGRRADGHPRHVLADPAHAQNAATQKGGIRFYAGMPLLTEERHVLGTLCVLDRVPRPDGLTQLQLDVLQTVATQVISQFELRRSLAQQEALLAEQQATIRERDALARVQGAIAAADGDLDTILTVLVANALEAVPAAEGGVLEMIHGDMLEYSAVGGTLEHTRACRCRYMAAWPAIAPKSTRRS